MGANKKTIATIGLFTLTLRSGCSQDTKHYHELSYQHNLAPLTATTQSNLPVTINMEHNSSLPIKEILHNFKIIKYPNMQDVTYKISKNYLTFYPKKDYIGNDNTLFVQGHDKNNKIANFNVVFNVNKNIKPTASEVHTVSMGNVPVTFSLTDTVTLPISETVKNIEIIRNYNPKAGILTIEPNKIKATFTATNGFSGVAKYILKLTDSNNYTVTYPLIITIGK